MTLHIEGESYEELYMEEDNSWGKYLLRSNGVLPDNLGRGI